MITERDLRFSSDFMHDQLPKEKRWMSRYFKTRTKRLFLKYFCAFGCSTRFCQHSGEICTKRYIKKMKRQFLNLTKKHEDARADFDLEALSRIETGKCKLN
jgi:hypothetical protein